MDAYGKRPPGCIPASAKFDFGKYRIRVRYIAALTKRQVANDNRPPPGNEPDLWAAVQRAANTLDGAHDVLEQRRYAVAVHEWRRAFLEAYR